MMDHLTPFEGVVFGGIIALGILSMLSPEDSTQMIGAIFLAAGFWGGIIALVRALLHREPGSLYVFSFVGALIAGLIKFFVFPDAQESTEPVIWAFIIGIGITGVVGIALNALIRKPEEEDEPDSALQQAKDAEKDNGILQAPPLAGEDADETAVSSDSETN